MIASDEPLKLELQDLDLFALMNLRRVLRLLIDVGSGLSFQHGISGSGAGDQFDELLEFMDRRVMEIEQLAREKQPANDDERSMKFVILASNAFNHVDPIVEQLKWIRSASLEASR